MPSPEVSALLDRYPAVIAGLGDQFSSHDFILVLAQQNQALYIRALNMYAGALYRGTPAPFRALHAVLAHHLKATRRLVRQTGTASSPDIFGESCSCATWQKV